MIRKDTVDLIAFLDELAKIDPVAMGELIKVRVPCNNKLAKHPTVQVHRDKNGTSVGLLGILNGYAGVYDHEPFKGYGPISALVEFDGKIHNFVQTGADGRVG